MYNSKLLDLFRTFSARDFRRFAAYIESPYFNTDEELVLLTRYLRKLSPTFSRKKLERKKVWKALYPKKKFDGKAFAYQMSNLLKCAEQFLGQEVFGSNQFLGQLHILEGLEQRAMDKHYKLTHQRIKATLKKDPFQTENKHLQRYELAGVGVRNQSRKQVRTLDRHLQETVRHLDAFYLSSRLRLTCELVNRQRILSATYDTHQIEDLLAYMKGHEANAEPSVAVYHQVLLLLTQEANDAHFQHLKGLLNKHLHLFPEDDRVTLVSYAQNYCIRRIRRGDAGYLNELFALYNRGLESGDLLDEGVLSPSKYKNIASVGLRLQAYDWVEKFIHDYLSYLPEEFRETGYAYNMAFLSYQRGKLATALKYLLQVEFNDIFFSLDTRKMMLMIYFEQGEEEAMVSLIAAFRTYLRRNTLISENNRVAYSNFVNLLNTIYKGSDSAVNMMQKISETQPLVEEIWLKRKVVDGFSPY